MQASTLSLLNAFALIAISLWAYVANGFSSESTLIPVGFGVLLLACQPWLRKNDRWVTAIAALLTLVIFIALFAPLTSSIDKGLILPVIRVGLMQLATAIALAALIMAFVRAFRRG